MCQPLPTHDFCWLTTKERETLYINAILHEGNTGYVFEVDLDYPVALHDSHSDYPLAPESFKIEPEMLSSYQKDLLTKLGMKEGSCTKLVPNLFDKINYVVHYRNLQLYLALGMRLTKIHRVLSFKQSPWLKAYIDFNTSKRKVAKNEFKKDFFKLMKIVCSAKPWNICEKEWTFNSFTTRKGSQSSRPNLDLNPSRSSTKIWPLWKLLNQNWF